MKKIILATSILLSSLFFGQAFAQTPADKQGECCNKQEQCDKQRPCPFDGLNLTAEQQAKLKEICAEKKDNKDKKDKQDKEARIQAAKERSEKAKAARQEYLNKVKSILSPEQYVKFLENSYLQKAPSHSKAPKMEGRHGNKMEKKAAKAGKMEIQRKK